VTSTAAAKRASVRSLWVAGFGIGTVVIVGMPWML